MKYKLLRQLYTMSRYALIGFLIQCVSFTFLMAENSYAQKSIEEFYLTVQMENVKVKKIFSEIEKKTTFSFAYANNVIEGSQKLSLNFENQSLADVLRHISKQFDLSFRRIGHTIHVNEGASRDDKVSEVLLQDVTVAGRVLDENGEGLPGASIVIKGSSTGTTTDIDGSYKLEVPENAVLRVSFVGYKTQEVNLAGRSQIDIRMELDAEELEELVVVGYQQVHQREVTGAVTSIKSEDLENIPVVSISSLLGTQSTGVQNIELSGAPGARGAVMIRGNTSISGDLDANTAFSNPLYVVDGVQTSLEDLAGYNVSNTDFLASLNPNDVERIDILKDASAAAIYGSRGANGVIIITTKKGEALEKPEFNFSTSVGVQTKPELVPMLVGAAERREKMRMIEQWWPHDQQFLNVPMVLTDSLNPAFNNNVDYQGLFYQPGVSKKYNLSVRGGAAKSNYRISLGVDSNKGVVKATGFDRYTLASNINSKMGAKFTNNLRINAVFTDTKTGQGNPYQGSFNLNSVLPVNPASLNSSLFAISDDKIKSLTGELDEKMNTDHGISTTLTNFSQFEIFEGLSFNSQFSFVYNSTKKNFYEPSTIRTEGNGFASYALYTRRNLSSDIYLSYLKQINNHEIAGILGNKIDYNRYEDMFLSAVGFGSDAIQVINNRYQQDQISGRTDISANALNSYFARFTYKYKNRYILGGNISMDGSSRFGKNVRWATFPSLSAAWVFSDEPFIQSVTSRFIDYAKVKFSWGINGKQFPNNYLRFGSYNLGYGGNAFWANQMSVSSYAGVTGVTPNYNAIGNEGLSWENSRQWNLGLEMEMFNQRLSVTFDAYNKNTDRLFFDIAFPSYSGYNSAKANVAGILNYGWESTLRYHVFPRQNDLRLELTVGLSRNRNFISKLPNGNRDFIGSDYGYVVGLPINLYKMFINDYIIDNLDQLPVNPFTGEPLKGKSAWAAIRPGFPIWKDLNGDYLLNETHDLKLTQDYSPVPDIQGSFNINLKYKGWYLRAYSQFSFGADIMNTVLQSYMDRYDRGGQGWATTGLADLSAHSFWQEPGDGAKGVRFPALYPTTAGLGAFYGFRGNQSLWLESGDYWRITNASVGYTFGNNSAITKLGLNRLRVFASVLNPWQWQKSKGVVDASMVDAKGRTLGNGYPRAATYTLGLDVRF